MSKIGLFGGTFDPIHNAHIAVAHEAMEEFSLDRIILIPAGEPPHKLKKDKSGKSLRLAMTELAVENIENFSVSDYEINLDMPCYSVNTVKHFRKLYPGDELYFIIGADSFRDMPTWWRYRELTELCAFIVISRPGIPEGTLLGEFDGDERPPRVFYSRDIKMDISSTAIRRRCARGEAVDGLVPPVIAEFIKNEGLYRKS